MSSIDDRQLTITDLKVLEFFVQSVGKQFSIREISRKIKTDYRLVYSSVQRLLTKQLIIKNRYGKTDLCEINLKGEIGCFIQVEKTRAEKFLKNKSIRLVANDIKNNIKNPYYTMIIFGSHARSKQTKRSDVDILFITSDLNSLKELEKIVDYVAGIRPVKIHSVEVLYKDFINMLKSKELNVAKEVLNNHIILHGAEAYYQMLREL